MLEKTFAKVDEVFRKVEEVFSMLDEEIPKIIHGERVTVENNNGHIEIHGPFKSLKINGCQVRFPGGQDNGKRPASRM